MRKTRIIVSIALSVLLCVTAAVASVAAEDAPIVYVSGAPALGMVERYDHDCGQYVGYIPSLLSAFSEEYGYDVRYLPDGEADKRFDKLNNTQADLITAASNESFYTETQWENGITVLIAEQNGQSMEYRLLFTDAAGSEFRSRLTAFMTACSEEKAAGLLLGTWTESSQSGGQTTWIIAAAAFATVLVLLFVILRLNRQLKVSHLSKEIDPITGIGNDVYLRNCYYEWISDQNRALYSAVYFKLGYDMPSAREIADNQNAALQYIAELLRDSIDPDDILARVDERGFFVLKATTDPEKIADWVQQMLMRMDVFLEKTPQSDCVYAGILPLRVGDRDLDSIVFNASYSSRYAQKNGRRFGVFSRAVADSMKEENELRAALGKALAEDQFVVYLQFYVNGADGSILGAEALSRWNHPSSGLLTPRRYISLLESENHMEQYDFMVLEKVCAILEDLCRYDSTFFISCNFMRKTIIMPGFLERFESVIEQFHFPRECLHFEITEYSLGESTDLLYSNIERIRALGVQIVIDDFGSGCSDVFDLGHFISNSVKLDRSLVSGNSSEKDDMILAGLIGIFEKLGITVIAEGIETKAQADRLLRLGCSMFQGYYYYLPMPASEAKRLILANKA